MASRMMSVFTISSSASRVGVEMAVAHAVEDRQGPAEHEGGEIGVAEIELPRAGQPARAAGKAGLQGGELLALPGKRHRIGFSPRPARAGGAAGGTWAGGRGGCDPIGAPTPSP